MKITKNDDTRSFFEYLERIEKLLKSIDFKYELTFKEFSARDTEIRLVARWKGITKEKANALVKKANISWIDDLIPDTTILSNSCFYSFSKENTISFKECLNHLARNLNDEHGNVPYASEKDIEYFMNCVNKKLMNLNNA